MSFAIIPCEYIEAFADYGSQLMEAREAKSLNRYHGLFNRAVVFYDGTVFPAMSRHAQEAQDLDPLQTLFATLGNTVVPVAAAGNFGLDFPFWPDAWGQVISVSASEGEGFYPASSWDPREDTPLLSAETGQGNASTRISNYGEVMIPGEYTSEFGEVSGTSFAAPRLSFVLATYLSEVGDAFCRDDDGNPAMAYGDWENLTLDEAAEQYCPELGPYLP